MRHHVAWVENAGLEDMAPDDRGGKRGTKYGVEDFRGVLRGAEHPLNAANFRSNVDFTSLKYMEHMQGNHHLCIYLLSMKADTDLTNVISNLTCRIL